MEAASPFGADEATVRSLFEQAVTADLVTATPDGPLSTFLPVLYEAASGAGGAFLGHLARSNPQWRAPVLGAALLVVRGPDAYVSPSWYPSRADHGRVVPTWNYLLAHVYGRLVVHDEPSWTEQVVRRLTARHEAAMEQPWSVDDAPASYIETELRGIVGVELLVERVEAKDKWGQNRPPADVDHVIDALDGSGQHAAAEAMRRANGR